MVQPPQPPTAESALVPAAVAPVASVGPTSSPLALAASGDLGALKSLELKKASERTPEEALAISAGHAALARADADRLAADIATDPALLSDKGTMAYLYRLALDPDVAPTLLAALARLESPIVADLLFDLVSRGEPGARLTLLTEDLLLGPAVRPEASKALAVTLELRAAKSCDQAAALLGRATTTGDERAVPHLERFLVEDGCGPKKKDDCWPCLRDDERKAKLEDAIATVKKTRVEAPWRLK